MLEPIIVVFGCDLNYAPHLAATIMSILANGGEDSFVFTILQQDFDPATWKGELTLVAHEFLHITLVPHLLELLHQRAPGMKLRVHSQYSHQLNGLERIKTIRGVGYIYGATSE